MDNLFKSASGVLISLALLLSSCSKTNETAGGVTDIGNSVAQGIVVTEANQPVARARVVAYYDNWTTTGIRPPSKIPWWWKPITTAFSA